MQYYEWRTPISNPVYISSSIICATGGAFDLWASHSKIIHNTVKRLSHLIFFVVPCIIMPKTLERVNENNHIEGCFDEFTLIFLRHKEFMSLYGVLCKSSHACTHTCRSEASRGDSNIPFIWKPNTVGFIQQWQTEKVLLSQGAQSNDRIYIKFIKLLWLS